MTIRITCEVADRVHTGKFKELGRWSLSVDSSLSFPYEQTISTLRVLYPYKDLIINFTIL